MLQQDESHPLDMEQVRGSFPALSQDQVFFDNAGGSQTLGTVVEAIRDYLINTNVQLGATYATGKRATARYDEGYSTAAKYINASVDEVVIGPSTTQLFRNLSYTLRFDEGDELVISGIDHEANIASWVDLAERQNLVLKWWKPSLNGDARTNPKLLAEDLEDLLSTRTRLVAFTHASNILGTIHDVAAIAQMAHARSPNTLVCVDAVAYAPHRQIDVKELGVDFYSFSWYKVYGPHIAMLYVSPNGRSQMRSLGHFFNSHETLADKLGLAAASYELVAAIPAVVEYLSGDGPGGGGAKWPAIRRQESRLQETLLEFLTGRDDVTIWGERNMDPRLRVSTISFTVRGWNSRELVEMVEKECNVGFRWGAFYSDRLVREVLGLGEDGVVRVSMVHYNTVDETKAFIAVLVKVLTRAK